MDWIRDANFWINPGARRNPYAAYGLPDGIHSRRLRAQAGPEQGEAARFLPLDAGTLPSSHDAGEIEAYAD
jgi:hypothetical protein